MKWRPDKLIAEICRETARKAAADIRSSAPRVAHRDGGEQSSGVGGSFVREVLRKDFVAERPWGAVILWQRLGQRIMWFVRGTVRQKPRPVALAPEPAEVFRRVKADAERFWARRAERMAP